MVQQFWELLHDFNVGATFGEEFQLYPIWEGDQSLIELLSRHYSGSDLASLNVFRQHKKVINVSCIVLCDGRAINTDCLSMICSHSDRHKFSLQYPACLDHFLWKAALKMISSPFYTFPTQLGNYVDIPHKSVQWLICSMGKTLHKTIKADGYIVYIQRLGLPHNLVQSSSSPIQRKEHHLWSTTQVWPTWVIPRFVCTHGQDHGPQLQRQPPFAM